MGLRAVVHVPHDVAEDGVEGVVVGEEDDDVDGLAQHLSQCAFDPL